jgi:hypothetical protein
MTDGIRHYDPTGPYWNDGAAHGMRAASKI